MSLIFNKKIRIIIFSTTLLLLSCIIMILAMIHTFHNEEEFENTTIVKDIVTEQTDMIYEFCIKNNIRGIKYRSFEEIFGNTNFLDSNYQFIIRTSKNTYQSTSDNILEKYDYLCSGTEMYIVYDSFNEDYVTIYVESYISTKHSSHGKIYKAYDKFKTIDSNFAYIAATFVILICLLIINVVYLLISRRNTANSILSKINNIYYEFPVAFMLILIEVNSRNNFIQFSFTNYFGIFIKILLLLISIYVLSYTTFARGANKTFTKSFLIIQIAVKLVKFIKYICGNLNHKLRAPIILLFSIALETFSVLCIYYDRDACWLLWSCIKIIEAALLLHYFSNICKLNAYTEKMQSGISDIKIDTKYMYGVVRENADYINNLYTGFSKAVEEQIKSEQLKTELITNVSHDLKTPLTSIINYVDLMKKENLDNEKAVEYLEILDKHSKRLKTLTENVIEASKAATGNMEVNVGKVNIDEMLSQALGEYESKFNENNLTAIYTPLEKNNVVQADGNLLWRVIDNIFSNVYKYSMENTRVYIDVTESDNNINVVIKNISKYQLNIPSDELMQRFVRGDASRSASGNGLGLSISHSLMKLQNGKLEININGDLFTSHIYINKGEVNK
ncbi:MAG: HAMP domain-containing histidine kinase [Lachnospiraceae bacterium]|nr:HAMP domain-containing histidine kinase [Lachnospiraceae bacterium]